MRQGIIAMENNSAEAEQELALQDVEPAVDQDIEDQEAAADVAETEVDRIEEGEGIAEVLTEVTDNLEATELAGGDITEQHAKDLAVVVEYFKTRLGVAGSDKLVFPAMEAFAATAEPDAKKTAIASAISHNRTLILATERSVALAQEGFGARMGDRFKFLFSSNSKLAKKALEASKAFDAGTPKSDNIVDPGWGRHLNAGGKAEINGTDVIARLKETEIKDLDKIKKQVKDIVYLVRKAGAKLSESFFMSNKAQIEALQKTADEISAETVSFRESVQDIKRGKVDASFKPLNAAEKNKLYAEISRALEAKDLKALIEEIELIRPDMIAVFNAVNTRLAGGWAKDVRIMQRVISDLDTSIGRVYTAYNYRNRLVYSAVKYIEASTGANKSE